MKDMINTTPLLIPSDRNVDHALLSMLTRQVSCGLVYDRFDQIIGIVTKGDILRNVSLSDPSYELNCRVNSIMSGDVEFAVLDSLVPDIRRLRRDLNIAHFPVKRIEGPPSLTNLVGVVSIADVARTYVDNLLKTEVDLR